MPELPEVEVTRRGLTTLLIGAQILQLKLGKPLRWPLGVACQTLVGRRIQAIDRRGKYLLLRLDEGVLLIHLGMSGHLTVTAEPAAGSRHDHFEMQTSQGILRLHDPRRFGAVVYSSDLQHDPALKLLSGLGVEPFSADFEPAAFHAALKKHRAAIKSVLLSGKVVVGVGNIYASEALFAARIHPATPAGRLSSVRSNRLHAAILQVLEQAIAQGGSSLRDFADALGQDGHFQLHASVYGRAGQPCKHCGRPIRMMVQGQRSTYYCPRCQRW